MDCLRINFMHYIRRCNINRVEKFGRRLSTESPAADSIGGEVEVEVEADGVGGGGGGWARRVLTGLQPTGALHVGNYFSCVRSAVRLQDQGEELLVCIADLHTLTSHHDGSALQERVLQMAAALLAAGLEPARCILFRQSAVPRHAELCWLLACLCSHARLAAMPQYRARVQTGRADSSEAGAGTLLYPVLQAADILLYRATHVPVGADQLQHLQLAAHLARAFRHRYTAAFPEPRPLTAEDGSDRIRSLRDPLKKMSKSDADPKSRILLTDTDDVITLKIRKAVTDFTPQVTYDMESRPGVSNLVRLHCLAAGLEVEEALEEAAGLTTAQYKLMVSGAVCRAVSPVRSRAASLLARPHYLHSVLAAGAARARLLADSTYADVSRAAGLATVQQHYSVTRVPLQVSALPAATPTATADLQRQ